MALIPFEKTKATVEKELNKTYAKILAFSEQLENDHIHQRIIDGQPPIIRMFYNCYQFNSSLIGVVNQIVEAVEVGEINNIDNYTESDFFFTRTIFALHNDHGTINTVKVPDILELDEIVHLLQKQIRYFCFINDLFPEDFGVNYRKPIKGIADIPLDLYQVIHLCLLNMKEQMEKISIQQEIFNTLQDTKKRKETA